ncbi:hypothetical protein [Chryseobacterium koreense]
MKKILFICFCLPWMVGIDAQVGINTAAPATTLEIVAKSPATHVEGILIPKLTGDQIFNMPISAATNEGNLVYATSPASVSNQTGVGVNLTAKGYYYWDGTVWVSIANNTTIINNILALVKPMNFVYGDNNDFPQGGNFFNSPHSPDLKLLNPLYGNSGGTPDLILENNPLGVQMWDNATSTIKFPQQLKGYAVTINVSLKYQQVSSNSLSTRLVAYTGDAVTDGVTGFYISGGTKLKDLFFKLNATSGFSYVRDELVMSPVIVTQEIVDHGIKLFVGGTGNTHIEYYEPVISVNYGVVNTTL